MSVENLCCAFFIGRWQVLEDEDLEDGSQLHYDNKIFMKWGSVLNHESHLSSYMRCEGGQNQLGEID